MTGSLSVSQRFPKVFPTRPQGSHFFGGHTSDWTWRVTATLTNQDQCSLYLHYAVSSDASSGIARIYCDLKQDLLALCCNELFMYTHTHTHTSAYIQHKPCTILAGLCMLQAATAFSLNAPNLALRSWAPVSSVCSLHATADGVSRRTVIATGVAAAALTFATP